MAVGQADGDSQVIIRKACSEKDFASFRELVTEFLEFLNEDLSFQVVVYASVLKMLRCLFHTSASHAVSMLVVGGIQGSTCTS